MGVSFKYWDDCADPADMEAMWKILEVNHEWLDAGEEEGQKVHMSRDPDGQPYLTQTEMKAVTDIIISRHFDSQMDSDMICAIANLESDRQPLTQRYDRKTKITTIGIMQISPSTVEWLVRDEGYKAYEVEGNPEILHRPFVNVYFGAAYIQWLSKFEQKARSEEFVVRAYKGGTKKASHKKTLPYWQRYISVKESLLGRKVHFDSSSSNTATASAQAGSNIAGNHNLTWDARVLSEDMEQMWNHPDVHKEWDRSGEKRGKVRLSVDPSGRPYISTIELKAVADIIVSKYFSTQRVDPITLCGLAEVVSMRFLNGAHSRTGIMGIDYATALWLYKDLSYRAHRVDSAEDLTNPFVSMYFGAAYVAWLSEYEGRERSLEFIVQAYLSGPKKVNLQEPSPLWLKFEEALSNYERKRSEGSCTIM